MDPGNWATSIAGGSKFGYALLFVALLSNIMAIVLQSLCARLAIASGRDLAQACRDGYPPWAAYPLWVFAETAIIATDVAEVIGTAIGLNLLFGIPLEIGVLLTALDVFIVLLSAAPGLSLSRSVHHHAARRSSPSALPSRLPLPIPIGAPSSRASRRRPTSSGIRQMLYLALGILGATVMPHNLYLHSAIVQTRDFGIVDAGESARR